MSLQEALKANAAAGNVKIVRLSGYQQFVSKGNGGAGCILSKCWLKKALDVAKRHVELSPVDCRS